VTLDELKHWAQTMRPDLPGRAVLDYLLDRYEGQGTVYTPGEVVQALRPVADPSQTMAALGLLAGEPLDILKGQWVFVDDDGRDFPISSRDVQAAVATGEFFHPRSGNEVHDFKSHIALFFLATATLAALLDANRRSR
jgi:hypothetical protein